MNKRKRVTGTTIVLTIVFVAAALIASGVIGIEGADFAREMGVEVRAVSSSCNCEVYNASPTSMTLAKGKSQNVRKVYRYSFRIKNAETFSSLKNVIKGLNGKAFKPTAFTWVSGNEKVAKVNSKGNITGVRKGTTYIYPIRNTVCSYKTKKSFVLYTDINLVNGLNVSGAFAVKVKVK